MPDVDPLQLLTMEALAELLSVNERWLHTEVKSGRLTALHLGRKTLRFRRTDIELWLDSAATSSARSET